MDRYSFSTEKRAALESLRQPFAVYQFIDKRVVTLILSDGFCELFGYADREEAVYDMDHDMYKDTHPDDVSRISNAAFRFASEGGTYDVIYRSRSLDGAGYRIRRKDAQEKIIRIHFFLFQREMYFRRFKNNLSESVCKYWISLVFHLR